MTTTTPILTEPGKPAAAIDFETTKEVGFYGLVWRRFKQRKIALAAAIVLATIALSCVLVPFFLPADCVDLSQLNQGAALGPLSIGHSTGSPCVVAGDHFHLLGTDLTGRDLLRRNLEGGRISLLIGLLVMTVTIFIATIVGAVSGFFGGIVDLIVNIVTNLLLSVPSILLLIMLVRVANASGDLSVLGLSTTICSIGLIVIAISLIAWPGTARIVRSVILSAREKEFIEAARAVGTSKTRIIVRHLIPNALGPIVVSASLTVGAAILIESAISFLGYGINAPTATWGSLLDEGRNALVNNGSTGIWYALWPGLLILLVVLSFNYIGDALRDAFDPRSLER